MQIDTRGNNEDVCRQKEWVVVVNMVCAWGQTNIVVIVVLKFSCNLSQLSFYGGQFSTHVHLCRPKSTQIA